MKSTTTLIAAGLATLVLGACGGGESDSAAPPATTAAGAATPSATVPSATTPAATTPSREHNDADVMFAQMMILHHRQAVEMAKLAEGRAASPEVKKLAAAIEAAQDPEIRTMSTWLTTWGEDVPEKSMPGMDHGGHGGGMPGMMSEADMMTLKALSGVEFDRSWLTMMIAHHQGAIQMARQQRKNGANPVAVALARKIQSDQAAEITTMKALFGTT